MILTISKAYTLAIAASFLLSPTAFGDEISTNKNMQSMTVGELIDKYEENDWFIFYIGAVFDSISWANTYLSSNGREKIYCPPKNLGFTSSQYAQILYSYVDKNRNLRQITGIDAIGFAAVNALVYTFPCKN